jgi:hypothetical protein
MFGLLPGIVLHFAFDAFWFAMPLFATTAAGIRVQQIIIVAMIFVPLWIVLFRRIVAPGVREDLPLNASWHPAPITAISTKEPIATATGGVTPSPVRWVMIAGIVAAAVWIAAVVRLPAQRYALSASRTDAITATRSALDSARLGPEWRFLPLASDAGGSAHRFVWTTAGRATYESLLGTYLNLPGWQVFVRKFEGDVADRAENWTTRLGADGMVLNISHELPVAQARIGPAVRDRRRDPQGCIRGPLEAAATHRLDRDVFRHVPFAPQRRIASVDTHCRR